MMRAQVRLQIGKAEEALEDLQMVNTAIPGNPQVLSPLLTTLAKLGRTGEAIDHLEHGLSVNPQSNALWALRAAITSSQLQATQEVVQRWQAALPESPQLHETIAQLQETLGELDAAEASADKALSITPNLPFAQFIKLRAEIRKQPKQALLRLDALQRAATNTDSERMVFAWRGLTYDKLQQYDKAAESFRQMIQHPLIQHALPQILPPHANESADIAGTLLWGPTGTRMELVLQALSASLGTRLLADRNLPTTRNDGFGHQRGLPDTPQAGKAARWQNIIRKNGLEPETVVDWIPHFDGYTASELKGARTIAIITDPRDAFINWLVFGSSQAFMFHPDETLSAEWLAQTCESFADHLEQKPEAVSVIKIDGLPGQASSVAQALQAALALEQAPDAAILGMTVQARGGFDNQFTSGHWRHYRESYRKAFDRLTPVAVRLGYSED